MSRHLVEPDGRLGRSAAAHRRDRLCCRCGYGAHHPADVDVVVVVLSGRWCTGGAVARPCAPATSGCCARAPGCARRGRRADGAHVLQTYLRTTTTGQEPATAWCAGRRAPTRLGRPRPARRPLWIARVPAREDRAAPPGLRVVATRDRVWAGPVGPSVGEGRITGPATVCVWQLDRARPLWAVE